MNQIQPQDCYGRETFYLADEDHFVGPRGLTTMPVYVNHLVEMMESSHLELAADFIEEEAIPVIRELQFRFGRMFAESKIKFNEEDLLELANTMYAASATNSSKTPAGYTFLGQFIDHDIDFDDQRLAYPPLADMNRIFISRRSPALDLDSLYGRQFRLDGSVRYMTKLYEENDRTKFKIGRVVEAQSIEGYQNDLWREPEEFLVNGSIKIRHTAVIGDVRNDENLGLSQTVVAFLRFHNAVVDKIRETHPGIPDVDLFELARQTVIKHYQWIVLHGYLPEILDTNILDEVLGWAESGDERLNWLKGQPDTFVPVEFAGAAFRLGHSMLKSVYDWNDFFKSPDRPADTFRLFEFTALGGLDSKPRLRGDWIIDWSRFYDFSAHNIKPPLNSNKSGSIDVIITNHLNGLAEFLNQNGITDPKARNLANRNLLRGNILSLPTGQQAAEALKDKLAGKRILTPDEIAEGPHEQTIRDRHFHENTPLWYYILKEAQILGDEGNHLGPVGSYIVAETLVLLVLRSDISILKGRWSPEEDEVIRHEVKSEKKFDMADLIAFAHTAKQPLMFLPQGKFVE